MSTTGKWREEQVLIICPGSQSTMAQLGCSELTPPTTRFPTRMFRDGEDWRPYHTFQRTRVVDGVEREEWVEDVDSDEGAVYPIQGGRIANMDAFLAFLDHVHGMLTTTYHNTPIMLMASPQWTRPDCETITQYIFEKTRTPALCLIHSAIATQYGLRFPNVTVVDIGYEKVDVTAIHDGRVVSHVDVGGGGGDSAAGNRRISGGEVFTRRLLELLEGQGFTREMAEQLKKSPICEVLPYATGSKDLVELPAEDTAGALASSEAAAAGVENGGDNKPDAAAAEKPEDAGENGDANGPDDEGVLDVAGIVTSGQTKEFLAKKEKEKGRKTKDEESIATKAARFPNSKRTHNSFSFEEIVLEEVRPEPKVKPVTETPVVAVAADPPVTETPAVTETTPAVTEPSAAAATDAMDTDTANGTTTSAPENNGTAEEQQPSKPTEEVNGSGSEEKKKEEEEEKEAEEPAAAVSAPEEAPKPAEEPKTEEEQPSTTTTTDTPEMRPKRIRREIEVGPERFTFAGRDEIDRIVSAIYYAIQGIDDMYMRPSCWDNLVFVGNGARLRGLKDNILQTLQARHLVSPSNATMFTSELPSNMATPSGTGTQTPTGSVTGTPHQLPAAGGVNPLLQAATTASSLGVAAPGAAAAGATAATSDSGLVAPATHHFHSQTPTSIKTVSLPTYLQEWTKHGFEEAMFLGAQVAARIVFCLHSNMDAQGIEAQRLASLSRVDYNEFGPKAIRNHSMLG